MSGAIPVYQPQVKVTLTKIVGRRRGVSDRFRRAVREIDLTPYLGEQGSVQTSKGLAEPAGGWTVVLADRMSSAARDSLYGLIEPMDHIEIRMAREPHRYAGGLLPIVMRGFVSQVRRVESMSPEGRPSRSVVLSGQDYGKLFGIFRIFYEQNHLLGQELLTTFRLCANSGVGCQAMSASEFVSTMVEQVVNRYIDGLDLSSANGFARRIQVDASVKQGTVGLYGVNPQEGSVWDVISRYADLTWNEMFVEDREDGVYLVYRPAPFKDARGKMIQTDAKDPGRVDLDISAVQSMDLYRSDYRLANYFWVYAPAADLHGAGLLRQNAIQGAADSYFIPDHFNASLDLFGLRMMETTTMQGNSAVRGDGQPAAVHDQYAGDAFLWAENRRRILRDANQDNLLFEEGSLGLRGDERLRPGRYLAIQRGDMTAEYYLTQVTHQYMPFGVFRSSVQVERGTGFIQRINTQDSPYLKEGRRGAYQ